MPSPELSPLAQVMADILATAGLLVVNAKWNAHRGSRKDQVTTSLSTVITEFKDETRAALAVIVDRLDEQTTAFNEHARSDAEGFAKIDKTLALINAAALTQDRDIERLDTENQRDHTRLERAIHTHYRSTDVVG